MEEKKQKQLDTALWIAQILLATMLILAAFVKLGTPLTVLYETQPWTKNMWLLLGSCLVDVVAAIFIIVPAALDRNNKWTIYAGYGILAIMIAASVFHMYNGLEYHMGESIVCAFISILVIWGRTKVPTIKTKETLKEEKEAAEKLEKEQARKAKREEAKRKKTKKTSS